MQKEIQQGKCLPNIRTEADFKAASERGYGAATEYLADNSKPFTEWTTTDLAKLHKTYFGEIYPHAGNFRPQGDMAVFNGRVGADGKNILQEVNMLFDQVRTLSSQLPPADTPSGLTERIRLIAFVHGRLALIHPFQDGNGRWTRLITSSLEKELLPNTETKSQVPRAVYMHAMKALPSNLGPLMNYHAEKHGLRPSTLKPVRPPFPVQVTVRE
jgi:fido (protein-threonine AMPylation protein)